jgi:hypothetical protein
LGEDHVRLATADLRAASESAAAVEGVPEDASGLALKLEKITSKSLDKADQILDLPLDPDSETFGPTLRAQTAIVGQALTTQVRGDENQMRVERTDGLAELIRNIAEEQKRRLIVNGEGKWSRTMKTSGARQCSYSWTVLSTRYFQRERSAETSY